MGCLPGLEGQTALVLQETTSARTPAQGTPWLRSHWSHAAGSARIQRKCSLQAVRPARASGRRGPWFQTLGSASGRQAGDARAEGGWPISDQGGPRSVSQAEDSPLPQVTTGLAGAGPRRDSQTGASSSSAGRRLDPSVRLFLFLFRWSWAERCSLPSWRRCAFCPCLFVLLSLTVFLKPCPECCGLTQRKPQQKLQEAQSSDSVASPLRLPRNGECISITVCLKGSYLDSCRPSSYIANKTVTVYLFLANSTPSWFEV